MSTPKDLKGLRIEDLHDLAREYRLTGFEGQSRASLLNDLESILSFETQSLDSLRQQAKDLDLRGESKFTKRQLAILLHRKYALQSLTVAELRRHLSNMNVANTSRMTKSKLVVTFLEHELEGILSTSEKGQRAPKRVALSVGAKPGHRRVNDLMPWLGKLMQVTSAIFILLSTVAIVITPLLLVRTFPVSTSILSQLRTSTQDAVIKIDTLEIALQDTSSAIDSAAHSLQSVSDVLDDSEPLIDSTGVLLGEALPDSIYAIQQGLIQAEDSARAIDQLLRGLAALGPITGVRYNPEMPLHEGIANTASGLDPLPVALIDVRDQLLLATRDLAGLSRGLRVSATDLLKLNGDLRYQKQLLSGLGTSIDHYVGSLDRLQQRLPALYWLVGLTLELLLIGFAVTHTAVFITGRSLVNDAKSSRDDQVMDPQVSTKES